jgi:hypothetical protein
MAASAFFQSCREAPPRLLCSPHKRASQTDSGSDKALRVSLYKFIKFQALRVSHKCLLG